MEFGRLAPGNDSLKRGRLAKHRCTKNSDHNIISSLQRLPRVSVSLFRSVLSSRYRQDKTHDATFVSRARFKKPLPPFISFASLFPEESCGTRVSHRAHWSNESLRGCDIRNSARRFGMPNHGKLTDPAMAAPLSRLDPFAPPYFRILELQAAPYKPGDSECHFLY